LIVDAFNKNGKKLKLVTNTNNKLYKELKLKSKENIEWIFAPSREELIKINSKAKAFLFPPEEDFGLVPVEAMAT
jgi:glycosyltransferase involved in cell wall biosynthesis